MIGLSALEENQPGAASTASTASRNNAAGFSERVQVEKGTRPVVQVEKKSQTGTVTTSGAPSGMATKKQRAQLSSGLPETTESE
ncbi:unnamed protein product, partial [Amoebophrya sp. A25]|eukprot:GSA25T00020420001.1